MSSRIKKLLRFGVFIAILTVASGGGLEIHSRLTKPLPALQPEVLYRLPPASGKDTITWPTGGQAAVGIVGHGVLATHGQQTPIATASTAKLITALAILKAKPLAVGQQGPPLTMSQQDIDIYNTYVAQE
ncbi:MAG: hypothetical protein ACREGB_05665, partial [Candidatus Saccharimonadales bacterium]